MVVHDKIRLTGVLQRGPFRHREGPRHSLRPSCASRSSTSCSSPVPPRRGAEQQLLQEALEQVELADRLGYHAVWVPERHFQEERSGASAPAVFLAAAAARTNTIRLGYGPVPLALHGTNPAFVVETAATLDLVSGGRVALAAGESVAGAELGAFGVARADQRARWRAALGVAARMMVETPFAGGDGMPAARQVVPQAGPDAAPAAVARRREARRPRGWPPRAASARCC